MRFTQMNTVIRDREEYNDWAARESWARHKRDFKCGESLCHDEEEFLGFPIFPAHRCDPQGCEYCDPHQAAGMDDYRLSQEEDYY